MGGSEFGGNIGKDRVIFGVGPESEINKQTTVSKCGKDSSRGVIENA